MYTRQILRKFKKYKIDIKTQFYPKAGRYASHEFDSLKITVPNSNNNTNGNSQLAWKPVCQSKEAISSYMAKNSAFKVSLYMTNLVMNPSNLQDFTSAFLDDELYMKQFKNQQCAFFKLVILKID